MGGKQVRAEGGCDCRLRLFAYFIQKSDSSQACVDARDAKGENENACDFFIGVSVNERAKRAGALNLSRAANSFIDILRV